MPNGVRFIATHPLRGTVNVVGPVTGIKYSVSAKGTPVSEYDFQELLKMVGPPCCGKFSHVADAKVRLFGPTSATADQVKKIPKHVLEAKPLERVSTRKSGKRYTEVNIEEKEEQKEVMILEDN